MAERRMIARSISVSEQVATLESDFARLLFTWMIAHADDYGVMTGSAMRVRAMVVPMLDHTTAEVEAALADMERRELIWRYERDGLPWLQFRTWEEHQSGLHKRTAPKQPVYHLPAATQTPDSFPDVPGSSRKFPASRARAEVEVEGERERKGTEGEGAREARAREDTPPNTADNAAIALRDRIATKAKLSHSPEVMEQLAEVIVSHRARGLSAEDIWREVLTLTDPSRRDGSKPKAAITVSNISNWLNHAKPAPDLAALAANNGHSTSPGPGRRSPSSRPREPAFYSRSYEDVPAPTFQPRSADVLRSEGESHNGQ